MGLIQKKNILLRIPHFSSGESGLLILEFGRLIQQLRTNATEFTMLRTTIGNDLGSSIAMPDGIVTRTTSHNVENSRYMVARFKQEIEYRGSSAKSRFSHTATDIEAMSEATSEAT